MLELILGLYYEVIVMEENELRKRLQQISLADHNLPAIVESQNPNGEILILLSYLNSECVFRLR